MKPLPYKISVEAASDLDEIWYYTVETWSVDQANRYYNLIFEEISCICEDPESGRQMNHVRKGYRSSKVKSHRIFYRIVNDTVEVIRILHQRMDIEKLLDD